MIRRAGWLALLMVVLAVGCATNPSTGSRSNSSDWPRARCLTDPRREAGETTRPLVFLFCVESP